MIKLPWKVYHDEAHVSDFQRAIGMQVTELQEKRDDLYLQLRPTTATWAMDWHEQDYGIKSDPSKPLAQRLAAWKAKRQGRGTTTPALLKRIAEELTGCPCEIVEHPENEYFEILIAANGDTIPALADLVWIVNEIKPAHLGLWFGKQLETNATAYISALASVRQKPRHAPIHSDANSIIVHGTIGVAANVITRIRNYAKGVTDHGE